MQLVPHCSGPLKPIRDCDASNPEPQSDAAYFTREKIWKDRDALTVYFMNENFIDGWRTGSCCMNTQNIVDWAKVWNSSGSEKIPKFRKVDRQPKGGADIRVMLKGEMNMSNSLL